MTDPTAAGPAGRPRAARGPARSARTYRSAAALLAAGDPVVGKLVSEVGLPVIAAPAASHLAALVRSILFQQLAAAAATAIHGRLLTALDGDVTAEGLLALAPDELRAAGLSAGKAASVRDLAAKVLDGTVILDPAGLRREADEEIIARLSTVRGVGRWTAQMFLMFELRRLDVWPTGDLGVRRGYGLAWEIPMPAPAALEPLGDPYRPYRSVVAWYCWRACDLYG